MITFQEILDFGLPIVLVYFVLSIVSSTLSQIVMDTLEIRGKTLERYLTLIAGDHADDLLRLPQLRALQPIKFKSWLSIFGARTEPKKLENIPVPVLVDAFFSILGLGNKNKKKSASEIKKAVLGMPESEGKRALLNWLEQGVSNLEDLRNNTNIYFSGLLEQSVATANAHSRSFVIQFAIGMVLLLNVDSIQIARDMYHGSQLQAVAAAQAEAIVQQENLTETDLTQLVADLDSLSFIEIGWFSVTLPNPGTAINWMSFIGLKIIGLAITSVFASQGSSFWFDILAKFK